MLEGIPPKTLKTWLIVAVVVYFVFPFDLIPDLFGLPGRLDDGLLAAFCVWFYRNHLHRYTQNASAGAGEPAGERAAPPSARTPHEVLGVPTSASASEIRAAYRERMQEYHPDKVSHLGEDLQQLAHRRSQEIQDAYRKLRL